MGKTADQVIADVLGQHHERPADYVAKRIISALDQHGYRIIRHRVLTDEQAAFLSKQNEPR